MLAVPLAGCGTPVPNGCGMSLCGCSAPETVSRFGQVVAKDGGAISGVTINCVDGGSLGATDSNGRFSVSSTITVSPGCGYDSCSELALRDPSGEFSSKSVVAAPRVAPFTFDAGTIVLSRPDGG
jgi:hypothetical protein